MIKLPERIDKMSIEEVLSIIKNPYKYKIKFSEFEILCDAVTELQNSINEANFSKDEMIVRLKDKNKELVTMLNEKDKKIAELYEVISKINMITTNQ